ncbi:MAG: arginine--tRNA ligase [Patescibacteria group bacterium]
MFLRERINEIVTNALLRMDGGRNLKNFEMPSLLVRAIEIGTHGDYASMLSFQLAKIWKTSPEGVGMALKDAIEKETGGDIFKKIDPVRGFLNFTLNAEVYHGEIVEILKFGEKYGSVKKLVSRGKKKSYSLDYLDANPTGPVHVGHARSGFLGDILSRVLVKAGHKVSREFYINNGKSSGQIQSLGKTALGKGEEYRHKELLELLQEPTVARKLKKMKSESVAGFFIASVIQKQNADFLKKRAGIEYDVFFEEQRVYEKKLHNVILKELERAGALYKKDGAVWFRAKNFGDTEDRVFVRKTGEPTYILPDVAYHMNRLAERKFDFVIDIFGADHHGYGPRLRGALQALGVDPHRVHIITMQTVRLMKDGAEFKMSKRAGVFVTLEDLIQEVGIDAVRFFFLMHSPDTHMDFDLSLAKEQSAKNPVYYVQYSYARIASIMRRAVKIDFLGANPSLLKAPEERALMKILARFPEIIEDSARDFAVLRLTTYSTELARAFHAFYENCRVISDDMALTQARLMLVEATRIVLKNTFDCMGINAPEKM